MEISRFMDEYRKHSPRDFFNWLSKGNFLEIRILTDMHGNKFADWNLIPKLADAVGCESRFSSLFIDSYEQLEKILLYKIGGFPLTRLYNIFIGVNPRRKVHVKSKKGLLYKSYYGGIAGTSHIQTVLCDIEHIGERSGNATEAMLQECIDGAEHLVRILNLKSYWINISGNGTHLWFDLEEPIDLPVPSFRETEDKVKYNLKEDPIYTLIKTYNRFIEKLNKRLKEFNPNLKVDEGAKDISRIARLVGSWNVKTGKKARAVGTIKTGCNTEDFKVTLNKGINKIFMAAKPILNKEARKVQEKASQTSKYRCNHLNIGETPLVKLLLSGLLPSTLSRNHFLERSMARLLRDNNISIDDISHLISDIDAVQHKAIQVDPDYLDDEELFNPEMVNSYCIACKVDLVYPILDDVPEVTGIDYISEEQYLVADTYSTGTLEEMAINNADKNWTKDYMCIKRIIRQLSFTCSKSQIFFTIKLLLKDEWEYWHRNRIILQLLNKTRRMNGN